MKAQVEKCKSAWSNSVHGMEAHYNLSSRTLREKWLGWCFANNRTLVVFVEKCFTELPR